MTEIGLLLDTKGMTDTTHTNANKKYNNEKILSQKENNEKM